MIKKSVKRGNVVVDIVQKEAEVCSAQDVHINGIKAHLYDFGRTKDMDMEKAPPCGCGNRVFIPKPIKPFIQNKYHLSDADVDDLYVILISTFSVGFCRRCAK